MSQRECTDDRLREIVPFGVRLTVNDYLAEVGQMSDLPTHYKRAPL